MVVEWKSTFPEPLTRAGWAGASLCRQEAGGGEVGRCEHLGGQGLPPLPSVTRCNGWVFPYPTTCSRRCLAIGAQSLALR